MISSILLTKLFIPSSPSGLVRRPHLVEALEAGINAGKTLTLIAAPAGYGKSTLLTEWTAEYPVRTAWLSLDKGDNNPLLFWTYVAKALETVSAHLGQVLLQMLESARPFDPRLFLTTLVNESAALEDKRILLVLDDYHVISEQEIHNGIRFLLEHIPPSLHLIIAARTDPPLPLSRMRVWGLLTEVRAADLRFTAAEAEGFLNNQMNLSLDTEDIQALETRTEGWIAGLQLAALSMLGRDDVHAFIQDFTGSQHFVLEYLVDEVLQRLPEELQNFLLQTSVLQRMCAPLCDAIMEFEKGSNRSADVLTELLRNNLFIIPLDNERYWLRYHHLFAEFLKGHLKRSRPGSIPELHRRAAEWFKVNNYPEEALRHALAIPDYSFVSGLVIDNWRRVYHTGRLNTAVYWLESLPGELLRNSPPLGVAYCWTLFIRGEYERIDTYLRAIEEAFQRMVSAGDLPADHPEYHIIIHQTVLLRTIVMRHRGDAAGAIGEIEKLLPAIEELGQSLGQTYAHMGFTACYSQLGYAYADIGDYDRAEEYLGRVSPHARSCGNFFSLAHATMERVKVALIRGKTEQAEAICRRELALAEEPAYTGYPAFCLIQLALADVLRTRKLLKESEALLDRGLKTAERSGHRYYLARGYLIAARLHHEQGEHDQMRADLAGARQIASLLCNQFLDRDIAAAEAALKGKSSDSLIEPLTERELEVLNLISLGKTNQEIADELFLALDTIKRHVSNLYGKLGINRRSQALMEARRLGLL